MPTPRKSKTDVDFESEALRQRLKKTPSFEPPNRRTAPQKIDTQIPPGWSSLESAITKLEVTVTVVGAIFVGAVTGALMVWAGASLFPDVLITSIGGALVGYTFLRAVLKT